MTSTLLDADVVRNAAVEALRRNDLGTMTTAAPSLYPHQWSWDAAFVAIGLAPGRRRARGHRAAQPAGRAVEHGDDPAHPLLAPTPTTTSPAPTGGAPTPWRPAPRASGPRGSASRRCTRSRCATSWTGAASAAARTARRRRGSRASRSTRCWPGTAGSPPPATPTRVGLVEIHHGWESGFDDSPRWDAPYARITPGEVPPFVRRDTRHVVSAAERPTDAEYTRYLWLVEQLRSRRLRRHRRAARPSTSGSRDVFFSAVLAAAAEVLAELADELGRPDDAAEQLAIAARFRAGVASTVDPATGLARDYDVLAGAWVGPMTVAGFAPLVAGGAADLLAANARCCAGRVDGPSRAALPAADLDLARERRLPPAHLLARARVAVPQPAAGLGGGPRRRARERGRRAADGVAWSSSPT